MERPASPLRGDRFHRLALNRIERKNCVFEHAEFGPKYT